MTAPTIPTAGVALPGAPDTGGLLDATDWDRRARRAAEGKPSRVACNHCGLAYPDPVTRLEACQLCGPHLAVWLGDGERLEVPDTRAAICEAAATLARGEVVALQSEAGLQLVIDARSEGAVRRLRTRTHRDALAFVVMTADVEQAREWCVVSVADESRLRHSEGPVVSLPRRPDAPVAASVVSTDDRLEALLARSPLHLLLLRATRFPVAVTGVLPGDDLAAIAELLVVDERPTPAYSGVIAD